LFLKRVFANFFVTQFSQPSPHFYGFFVAQNVLNFPSESLPILAWRHGCEGQPGQAAIQGQTLQLANNIEESP